MPPAERRCGPWAHGAFGPVLGSRRAHVPWLLCFMAVGALPGAFLWSVAIFVMGCLVSLFLASSGLLVTRVRGPFLVALIL